MLSKLAALGFLPTASPTDYVWPDRLGIDKTGRQVISGIRDHVKRPIVTTTNCTNANYAVTRLKEGPANIPEEVWKYGQDKKVFNDTGFYGKSALYDTDYSPAATVTTYDTDYDAGTLSFLRYNTVTGFTTNNLFSSSGSPTYQEPIQGGAGTCYFISAIASASEYPAFITDMFLTGTSNPESGIIGVKFYIRGKPWVVSIDDKLFFTTSGSAKTLKFAQESATDKLMWAPILEKAWAKLKGNYDQTSGGFNVSGLRSITGAPVFRYLTSAIGSSSGPT